MFRLLHAEDVECSLAAVDVVQVLGRPVQGQAFHALVLGGQQGLAAFRGEGEGVSGSD